MLSESLYLFTWGEHGRVKVEEGEELELSPEPDGMFGDKTVWLLKDGRKVDVVNPAQAEAILDAMIPHAWVTAVVETTGDASLGICPCVHVSDLEAREAKKEAAARKDSEFKLKAVGCCGALLLAFAIVMALAAMMAPY